MPATEKKGYDRDITYQVGWKKGKIHIQDPHSPEQGNILPEDAVPPVHEAEGTEAPGKLLTGIWRSLPYPTEKAAVLLAAALPLAAFAAIVWLVSKLSQTY